MPRPKTLSRVCPKCGAAKPNPYAKQCRECWIKEHDTPEMACVDCGKKFSTGERYTRCRTCYNAYKAANRNQTICTFKDCGQPFYAKGLCRSHYQVGRRTALWGNKVIDRVSHYEVKKLPCVVCGYAKLFSQVHRPTAKGPYIIGNMVPLCANCHREVHADLIPCPPAWQPKIRQVHLPLR